MDQRNEQFVPRLLAITVGTIVDFPNSDTKFHNVFSLSKTHPFDLGRYPPGKSGFERFDRPGLVRVFCDIHSHMSGYILVFSHRYFAVTDADGRYAIPRVPAGTYTLMLWSELGTAEPRRVTVTDGDDRRSGYSGRPRAMSVFSSLTNRIFIASAVLVLGSIVVPVYFVNVAVTAQANAELRRGLDEAALLVNDYVTQRFENFVQVGRDGRRSAQTEIGRRHG